MCEEDLEVLKATMASRVSAELEDLVGSVSSGIYVSNRIWSGR